MTNPFDKPQKTPSVSFTNDDPATGQKVNKPVGYRVGGRVVKVPETVQSTGYKGSPFEGKPLFWSNDGKGVKTDAAKSADGRDNRKVEDIVTHLQIKVGDDIGEERGLWCPFYPKYMYEAIQAALADRAIELGDELYLTIKAYIPVPGKNPARDYTAEFIKGQGAFAPAAAEAATPPPPPAPSPPAPPPPVVDTTPAGMATTPEGYTHSGLIAAGWTTEQITAAYPQLVPAGSPAPAPPAAPPPAASVAPDVADARAAKLAAMSDADKALLNLV